MLDEENSDIIFDTITIEGTLEVADIVGKNYELHASYIYVSGAFIIGWEDSHLENATVDIVLHGNVSTPEYVLKQATAMGAKSLGTLRKR